MINRLMFKNIAFYT